MWWTKLGRSRDDAGRRGPSAARASGTGAGAVAQAIAVSNISIEWICGSVSELPKTLV